MNLTPAERRVYPWLLTGLMHKEIASKLGLSMKTLKYHQGNILKKKNGLRRIDLLVEFVPKSLRVLIVLLALLSVVPLFASFPADVETNQR